MALTDKLTSIAAAIRGKTGGTDALTLDQMAAEIAGIETEPILEALTITENGTYVPPVGVDGFSQVVANVAASSGSMESGELTTTSANYWAFTIPVSSKKTHLLVLPKSFSNMWSQDTTSRERCLVAVEGIGHIQGMPGSQTDATEIPNGSSRWYFAGGTGNTVVFNSDSIKFTLQYSPWALGEYLWFAW